MIAPKRLAASALAALICAATSVAAQQVTNGGQPSLRTGTAGSPGADVLTTQGTPLMTPQRTFPVATTLTEGGLAPFVSGSASSSVVGKAGPGNLYDLYATCTSACWLMVFNATTVPADGATTAGTASGNLQQCIPIPSGGTAQVVTSGAPPEVYSVGIAVAISSTACATKTASSVGFIHGRAM